MFQNWRILISKNYDDLFCLLLAASGLLGPVGLRKAYTKIIQNLHKDYTKQSLYKADAMLYTKLIQSLYKSYAKRTQNLHKAYTKLIQNLHKDYTSLVQTELIQNLYKACTELSFSGCFSCDKFWLAEPLIIHFLFVAARGLLGPLIQTLHKGYTNLTQVSLLAVCCQGPPGTSWTKQSWYKAYTQLIQG